MLPLDLGLTLGFKGTNASPVMTAYRYSTCCCSVVRIQSLARRFPRRILSKFCYRPERPFPRRIAFGNTLEAITGGLILHYFCGGRSFLNDVRSTLCFLVPVSDGMTLISATVGSASLVFGHDNSGASFTYLWWTWWLGDTVQYLVIAPLIIGLANNRSELWNLKSIKAFMTIFIIAVGISFMVFGPWYEHKSDMLFYFTLGLIVISAFHLPMLGIAILCTAISAIALWGTKFGHGPFNLEFAK